MAGSGSACLHRSSTEGSTLSEGQVGKEERRVRLAAEERLAKVGPGRHPPQN